MSVSVQIILNCENWSVRIVQTFSFVHRFDQFYREEKKNGKNVVTA